MRRVFVYGSLMNPVEVARELGVDPSEVRERYGVRVAVLRGYRRVFNKRSLKWGAALNLECTGKPGDEVWGVLLEVSEEEYERIKRREVNYQPKPVKVIVGGEPVDAVTFISCKRAPPSAKPSKRYVEIVLKGAEYWGIKEKVLENLYLADGTPLANSQLFKHHVD